MQTLRELRPDMLLVQGDTTTVLATALAAFHLGVPVGHVEAGLRSHDLRNPFPEEMNRRLTSVLTALHLAPTPLAADELQQERIERARIVVTGNTVVDALHQLLREPFDIAATPLAGLPLEMAVCWSSPRIDGNPGDATWRIPASRSMIWSSALPTCGSSIPSISIPMYARR